MTDRSSGLGMYSQEHKRIVEEAAETNSLGIFNIEHENKSLQVNDLSYQ